MWNKELLSNKMARSKRDKSNDDAEVKPPLVKVSLPLKNSILSRFKRDRHYLMGRVIR